MIYSVRLYTVPVAQVPLFVAAFRRGGLWTDVARLEGHLHTDLVRNPTDPTKFLAVEFWISINTLLAARRSPELHSFVCWLSLQGINCEGFGIFVLPPKLEGQHEKQEWETCTPCLVVEKPSLESQCFQTEVRS